MNRAKSTRRVRLLVRMGFAHVPAPDGKALALALLEIATAHDSPPRVAGEHPPACLDLVVEVGEAREACERTEDAHYRPELPWVHILPVSRDVPPAREHEARSRMRMVEYRLGCSRRVSVDATRDQHDEHAVTPSDGALDDLRVVRSSRNDRDPPLEPVELLHALLPTDPDHLVAPVKRVLHHITAELPRRSNDANLHGAPPSVPSTPQSAAVAQALMDSFQRVISRL
jgi:hypothetical protein